jgi:hypothetical protein
MAIDENTARMLAEAYDETVAEASAQGRPSEEAHREGLTAAAMFLAAMQGMEDNTARAEVERLGLKSA